MNSADNTKQIKRIGGITWRLIFFPIMMIYMEIYFHNAVYDEINAGILYPCILSGAVGTLFALFTVAFKKIGNIISCYFITVVVTIYYIAQLLYYYIFDTFFSITSIKGANDAMNFKSELFRAMKNCIQSEIGMLVPLLVLILFGAVLISFERPTIKGNIICACATVASIFLSILSLNISGRGLFSPYSLYHDSFVMELSMKKLGLMTTTYRDACVLAFGNKNIADIEFNEEYVTIDDIDEYGYEPQIDKTIDLTSLYENASDEDIKQITAYISNKQPTYKNEYTGMYEGYNLVFITAESLSPYVVREDWMPMLYKMMNEGFVFDNYYNPTWYKSTIDGEFVNCLSQYPSFSRWSMYESADTYQPYALGNELNNEGYDSKAYHDYDFYYYDRSKTHTNLGYDFKAIGYGLELPSEDEYCSDLEMMQTTYDEFTSSEPFNVYFMTYSGHLPYDYEDNPIAQKNRKEAERLTEGLPYNDTVRAYIASQLELEYALEYLVDRLDEDGLLDNTLFVISPDHFPYVMINGDYDILAEKNVLDNSFSLYHSCFGIWNSKIEEPIEVDKICSSVDILPTVLNLMGVDYDSRLLSGRDMLYDEAGSAMFSDYSYIDEDICYDVGDEKLIYSTFDNIDATNDKVYEAMKKAQVEYFISDKIIEKDYYRYVYK